MGPLNETQTQAMAAEEAANPSADPQRQVGPALAVGILLLPGLFVWALLRKGYSAQERALGFGWLTFLLIAAALVPKAPLDLPEESAPQLAQAVPSAAPSAVPTTATKLEPTQADREREHAYLTLLDKTLADVQASGLIYPDPDPRASWAASVNTIGTLGTNYASGLWQTLSADGETRKRAWARKAAQLQARAFPRIRALQAKALDQTLWELDVRAQVRGPANATLRLTGYHFAANRNIKAVIERIHDDALAARLRGVEFEAYPGGAVTRFDLDPLPDTALATFAFNRWTKLEGD